MGLLSSIWTGITVARKSEHASEAFEEQLRLGHSAFDALDAAAAASELPIAAEVMADLHTVADRTLTLLRRAVSQTARTVAWVDRYQRPLRRGSQAIAHALQQLPALIDRATAGTVRAAAVLAGWSFRLEALSKRHDTAKE